jgi:hypothetical protein
MCPSEKGSGFPRSIKSGGDVVLLKMYQLLQKDSLLFNVNCRMYHTFIAVIVIFGRLTLRFQGI